MKVLFSPEGERKEVQESEYGESPCSTLFCLAYHSEIKGEHPADVARELGEK